MFQRSHNLRRDCRNSSFDVDKVCHHLRTVTDDQLAGHRRRWRTKIRRKVAERDVGLVANGGDYGNACILGHTTHFANNLLIVKPGEILRGPASPCHYDHVHAHPTQRTKTANDRIWRFDPLYGARRKHNFRHWKSASDYRLQVMDHAARRRCRDTNPTRPRGQAELAGLIKQTLRLQFGLE